MRGLRQRMLQRAGTLVMVALLVVPIIASAHTHRDLVAARSCATCVAAHHSPIVVAPAVVAAAPALAAVAPPPPSQPVPAHAHRSPRAGRAPPSPAPVSVA